MTIKKGHYGVYQGKEYRIFLNEDDTADLLIDGGTRPADSYEYMGQFFKKINRNELESAFSIHPKAEYEGILVGIGKQQDDNVLIFTGGPDEEMDRLGFKFIERGVFEKWVKTTALKNITEE